MKNFAFVDANLQIFHFKQRSHFFPFVPGAVAVDGAAIFNGTRPKQAAAQVGNQQ